MEGIKEIYELSKEVYKLIKNDNNGNKLIEILISVIAITSPSVIYIFLFKREIFNNLSEFKLILLCILLNLMLFLIFYEIILKQDNARLYKKMILCDYDFEKYQIELEIYISDVDSYGKEVEKVKILPEWIRSSRKIKEKLENARLAIEELNGKYENKSISEQEYKLKVHKLYSDIDKYKENYFNNIPNNYKILEGITAMEKIEEIGDIDKKSVMLDDKLNYLKEKYGSIKIELEKQKDRIFKAVCSNMIIVSLIPLIIYGLVIIYNYIFKTKYSISEMQILYFILVSIIPLILILNIFFIKLKLMRINSKIKKLIR